jgi:uncharacterized membrane protein
MSKPMFFYAGIYDNANDADTDLRAIKALNDSGAIGSYDAELITKKPNGEVKVTKTEKPTEHGAWWGVAAGAATVVLFPVAAPALLVAGASGGGAFIAHIAHGISRGEAKDIGKMLEDGDSAVVVVGIDTDAEQIEAAATHQRDYVLKRNVGDWDDAEQDALAAVKTAEATRA